MSESAQYYLPIVTPPVSDDNAIGVVYQPDHAGEGASRLLVQFEEAEQMHAMLRAHLQQMQALELAALQVRDAFDVDTAMGAQLDIVGWLVGERRSGKGDVAYRAYVKARIAANASRGRPSDLYAIARALLGDEPTLRIEREADLPAHYNMQISNAVLRFPWDDELAQEVSPDQVARALSDAYELATSGGVSFTIYYQFTDHIFRFASADAEEDDTDDGFADDDDETGPGGSFVGVEGSS